VARSGEPALLLVLDIDHFKRVNDTWGHGAGDGVIKAVASALLECVRPMDLVARTGGEEYAIVLPNCAPAFGEAVAERIRRRVEGMPVAVAPNEQHPGHRQRRRRLCAAVGALQPHLWLERADQQLYRAKARAQYRLPRTDGGFPGQQRRSAACSSRPPSSWISNDRASARITAVTSGKGGVGKTFVAANLAAALARQGRARAGARCRPGPGQSGRGAEPVPEDHAARRVQRQGARSTRRCCRRRVASRCCWPARAWSSTRA
jgi:diguanylate cyclase (GGDEF)-like protein